MEDYKNHITYEIACAYARMGIDPPWADIKYDPVIDRLAKAEKVLALVEAFIEKHNITCPETISQTDDVIANAYDFIESLCETAGYKEISED